MLNAFSPIVLPSVLLVKKATMKTEVDALKKTDTNARVNLSEGGRIVIKPNLIVGH